jgi:hypothetical protein
MVKKYSKYIFAFLWLTLIMPPLHSQEKQDKQVKQTHDVVLGFLQLKDAFGLGLVFNGGQLEYRYGVQWTIKNHDIQYQPQLGFGITAKYKMSGIQIHIAPVNVTWTMLFFEKDGHTIKGGANLITDYHYQWYELHDGPLFWDAEIGLSPVICYGYQWGNKRINVGLQNSLLGFTSRRQGYDPYFWMFTWKDFVVYPHKDLKFGSFNNYNHTKVSLEFVPNISKKHSIAYEFDYWGYFYGYRFQRINHNLIWRISL